MEQTQIGKKWGKLYDFGSSTVPKNPPTARNWAETNGIMKISSNTGYREPDVITGYDKDSKLRTYGINLSRNEFQIQLEKEFEEMCASVEKYGGFYIGRYETGNLSKEVPVVVKGNNDISAQTWYTMYAKSKKLAGANSNITTSMIWGCQWDTCLKWMLTSEDEETRNYVTDGTGKGNYTKNRKATGSSEDYCVNNIYDMAGNVRERTMEAYTTGARVGRGGFCYDTPSSSPASFRSSDYPDNTDDSFGLRVALYL